MKIVTYTAIIGDYDRLYEPYFNTPDVEMVCFTDNKKLMSDNWRIVLVERMFDDPARCARYFKILSHRLFPDATITIWVDGNLELLKALDLGMVNMLLTKSYIAAYPHDSRTCAYEEAKFCIERKLDDVEVIEGQMAGYRENGFPEKFGLAHTSFLVRRNVPAITVLNEAWWREIERGSKRDQLSFDYCRWELVATMGWIQGSIYDGAFFLRRKHKFEKGSD
jgi:hypothetical protein